MLKKDIVCFTQPLELSSGVFVTGVLIGVCSQGKLWYVNIYIPLTFLQYMLHTCLYVLFTSSSGEPWPFTVSLSFLNLSVAFIATDLFKAKATVRFNDSGVPVYHYASRLEYNDQTKLRTRQLVQEKHAHRRRPNATRYVRVPVACHVRQIHTPLTCATPGGRCPPRPVALLGYDPESD